VNHSQNRLKLQINFALFNNKILIFTGQFAVRILRMIRNFSFEVLSYDGIFRYSVALYVFRLKKWTKMAYLSQIILFVLLSCLVLVRVPVINGMYPLCKFATWIIINSQIFFVWINTNIVKTNVVKLIN